MNLFIQLLTEDDKRTDVHTNHADTLNTGIHLANFVVVVGAEAADGARGVFNNLRKSSLVRTALLTVIHPRTHTIYKHFITSFSINLSSSAGAIGLEYISSVMVVIYFAITFRFQVASDTITTHINENNA